MNELRMYVEHLFEDKVLTNENIELKEEIYGNLVARYEDYLSEGMSSVEALAKTKESITSIEDVLANETEDAAPGEAAESPAEQPAVSHASRFSASQMASENRVSADPDSADQGQSAAGDAAETVAMPRPEGAPVPPSGVNAGAATASAAPATAPTPRRKRKWPFVVAGVLVAILVLSVVGIFAFNFVGDTDLDGSQRTSQTTVPVTGNGNGAGNSNAGNGVGTGNGASGTGSGAGAGSGAGSSSGTGSANAGDATQYLHYLDPEDQYEHEMTSQLATEIQNCDAGELQKFTSGATSFDEVAAALPLGAYVESAAREANGTTLNIRYGQVHDAYDGDMVDRALVYNAVSLMALYPDAQTVNIALHEQGDHAHDADYFSFQRRRLENGLSNMSGNAITQINSSLFESTDAWDQTCAYILSEHFCDNQVDVAEVDD